MAWRTPPRHCGPWEVTGYVPNVVYSCGGIIYVDNLIISYAMSDTNSGIFLISVTELLDYMLN